MTDESKIRVLKRRERDRARRKRAILKAALKLFVERGYKKTKMETIAQEAGLSKGLLYFYFKSKDQILAEIIRENFSGLLKKLQGVSKKSVDPIEGLRKFVEIEVSFYTKNRPLSRLLYSLLVGYEIEDLSEEYKRVFIELHRKEREILEGILERGIEDGVFKRIDRNLLLHFVSGPLHSLIFFRRDPIEDPEGVAKELMDLLLKGIVLS